MDKQGFMREIAAHLFRLYAVTRMPKVAMAELDAYYDRNAQDYDALAYGARDCRLARFVHNRIVPLSTRETAP